MNGIERSAQSYWGLKIEARLTATTFWGMKVKEALRTESRPLVASFELLDQTSPKVLFLPDISVLWVKTFLLYCLCLFDSIF